MQTIKNTKLYICTLPSLKKSNSSQFHASHTTFSHEQVILRNIGTRRSLQNRLNKYFGNKAKFCRSMSMSTKYFKIHSKYASVTVDHINNAHYFEDCQIMCEKKQRKQCIKCRNLLDNDNR